LDNFVLLHSTGQAASGWDRLAEVIRDARLQVWLAAWVPDEQMTFLEDVRAHLDQAFHPGWIGKDPTTDDAAAQQFLYHDAWALTTRRAFYSEGVYNERITLNRRIPSVSIGAAQDRTILPAWQQTMARQRLDIEPIMIESGHCPNVSRPRELGTLLLEVARVRK
jgi:pimeloyl-ACP methyl ester carboxylesterase